MEQKYYRLLCLILPIVLSFTNSFSQEIFVENTEELFAAFINAQPGDEIVLKDGTYSDIGTPSIFRNGTETNNIIFRPETPGGVIFTGESSFFITADYWHIHGFEFREARSAPNEFLIPINMNDANHNRISQCAFINSGTQVAILPIIRLKNNSKNNRIDHMINLQGR